MKIIKRTELQHAQTYLKARMLCRETPYELVPHLADELMLVHLLDENYVTIVMTEDGQIMSRQEYNQLTQPQCKNFTP